MPPPPPPALTPAIGHDPIPGLQDALAVIRAWADNTSACPTARHGDARAAARLLAQNRLLGVTGELFLRVTPDPEVAQTIAAFRRLTAEMNGASLLLMRRLMVLMADIQEPVVVYKGVVLQTEIYGTPFARPSSDVDLLTAPRSYGRVAAALEAAGYRLNPHTDTLWWRRFLAEQQFRQGRDAQSIDLHHRIQQPGCPMPRRPERLFEMAVARPFLGGEVLTFSPAHAVLVASMGVAKALHHREPAGRYVADAERILRRLSMSECDGVRREAEMQGLGGTLDLTLRCIASIFGRTPLLAQSSMLNDIRDTALQAMVLAPSQATEWMKRRTLLAAICDRPADAITAWLMLAASETARMATTTHRPQGGHL